MENRHPFFLFPGLRSRLQIELLPPPEGDEIITIFPFDPAAEFFNAINYSTF
jgi:hypothetical protein